METYRTSMLTTRTYGSSISITFRRTFSSRCNRSRDIPVTLAHLNNIHFNRFQNEFHYFSRFHGNSCPAGKYISLANPPRLLSFSYQLSLLLTWALLFPHTCQAADTLLCRSPFPPCSVTHSFSLLSFSRPRFSLMLMVLRTRHKRLLLFCAVYVYTPE